MKFLYLVFKYSYFLFGLQLEKEALGKGVPIRQALDIEIPPPRPKRKPSNPYPRKTGVGTTTLQVGAADGKNLSPVTSFFSGKQLLDLEREPLPEVYISPCIFLLLVVIVSI